MTTLARRDKPRPMARKMLNKVPEVTVYFWLIKVLCTTVGETAADFLNDNLGFGLTNTSLIMSAVLIAVLVFQFRKRKYVPGVYWLAVVLISVVGTLISDNLTDNFGVSLVTTTIAFSITLSTMMFYFGYRYVPRRRPRVGAALVGGLLAACLWEVAKQLFRVYIRKVGVYDQIYGPLGVLVAFVMFVYYSAIVFVFGAAYVAALDAKGR